MPEGIKIILKFVFEDLKLHKIYAKLYKENIHSKKVLEKCGFKLDATMREARFKHGQWHDELIYGILKSEYDLNSSIDISS